MVQKDRSDETEIPKPGVEVEYKEFKLSEFLEIRTKQESAEPAGTGSTHGNPGAEGASPGIWSEKRRLATIMAIIFMAIAAIAGVLSLLRFFIK